MRTRIFFSLMASSFMLFPGLSLAQTSGSRPPVNEILLSPDPNDWVMFSRTYDNQRFSPLNQIDRENVKQLRLVWARGMEPGSRQEVIPLVHQGVMYVANPGGIVQALDATNGDLIWEYKRTLPNDIEEFINVERVRTLAIRDNQIFYASPDGYILAIGTENGELHWETLAHDYKHAGTTEHTTGPMVAETRAGGRVMTGRNCRVDPDARSTCFIVAHDADTGEELWRFYTPAGNGEPGSDTWGNMPDNSRQCSPWGMPSAYDPELNLVYWGVANPGPHTRYKRHNGKPFAVPLSTPSELYCNSTLALNADTGELVWYYQHLPGDDWDSDWVQERVLISSPFNPDPEAVKWFNPTVPRGEIRDMVVTVGEPGGLSVLDRRTGQFLWAIPFPLADTPYFHISHIDGETGTVHISADMVLTGPDDVHEIICFNNTRNYSPMAYHPGNNSLYIPYHDTCFKRTAALNTSDGHRRQTFIRPGADPEAWTGIAKVNMETGRIEPFHAQRMPTNGAVLATAGDLIFSGDMNRRFRAYDADSGDILWETIVGAIVQNSTITYAVDGKQYVAVLTGDGVSATSGRLALVPELKAVRAHNTIYVFALPDY
jgi:PQQ-dependent dehydrogenase (methanol/ethanol family)